MKGSRRQRHGPFYLPLIRHDMIRQLFARIASSVQNAPPVVSKPGETGNATDGFKTIRHGQANLRSSLENLNKESGMSANIPAKSLLDAIMVILLALLMADRHTGNILHEILGVLFTGAFLLHTGLNRHWYGTLLKGPYPAARSIRALLNILLLLAFMGTLGKCLRHLQNRIFVHGFKGRTLFQNAAYLFRSLEFSSRWQHTWGSVGKKYPQHSIGMRLCHIWTDTRHCPPSSAS